MAYVSKHRDMMPIIGADNYQSVVGGSVINGETKETKGYE